ncbi:TolB family protein [Streptosporangium carneum]|uniref:Uncharacterized protein n=1 Tax=Streptosporangium carneum TaxID=47481 RepID=A0A9W6MEL1_9ACTN|nr:hypothetical protein [Streptosporangium carneum]GLK11095.1 hypothetical protein GCM10017600_45010 [Streptosporangium carneum]
MSEWDERIRRTASLLGGPTEYADRMADRANIRHSEDGFFTLYRSFLSRLRRWPNPAWGDGLSRTQRAVLVALHHDGRTEQETAYLCGRSRKSVRRAERQGLLTLGTDAASLAAELQAMTGDLPEPRERKPGGRWGPVFVCLALAVLLTLLVVSLMSPGSPLSFSSPSESWPALARIPFSERATPLRLPTRAAVRHAFLDERGDTSVVPAAFPEGSVWVAVTETGERLLVEDAEEDLAISPDGHRLAYRSRKRDKIVIVDLPSGRTTVVTGREGGFAFSPDGRRLAVDTYDADLNDFLYVWDGALRRVPADSFLRSLSGWSTTTESLLFTGPSHAAAVGLNGRERFVFEAEDDEFDVEISPDGRTALEVDDKRNGFIRHGERTGRRDMALPATAKFDSFEGWASADEFVIRTIGYGPSDYYRVNVDTGAATPVAADIPYGTRLVSFPAPGRTG